MPEPSQIEASGRLAVEARHARLLDVAVAAEALQALDRVPGRALAEPVLEHGVGEAAELGRLLVAGGDLVVGAGEAHRRDRRRLGLDAEVGEHVAHQRLVDQLLAEGGAVGGVVERLHDARRGSRWRRRSRSRAGCG